MRLFVLVLLMSSFAFGAKKVRQMSFEDEPKKELEKVPKALFLIKKAKIGSDVGEPQFYPGEAQLRTVLDDPALQTTKNY